MARGDRAARNHHRPGRVLTARRLGPVIPAGVPAFTSHPPSRRRATGARLLQIVAEQKRVSQRLIPGGPVSTPPSTGRVTPVIQDASAEARKATAAAMSW